MSDEIRIVIVDDERDARQSLQRLLQLDDYNVWTARDGLEAMATIAARRPHVVLVDICMPGIDGIELTRRIRAACGHEMLIIAVTGTRDAALMAAVTAEGADHLLTKPVDVVRLFALLSRPRPGEPG